MCTLIHPFLMPTQLLLVPIPGKDLFFPSVLHFLKSILVVQGGLALVLQVCIYCAFIKLTSLLCYSSSITITP
jgi:hypothetical protein